MPLHRSHGILQPMPTVDPECLTPPQDRTFFLEDTVEQVASHTRSVLHSPTSSEIDKKPENHVTEKDLPPDYNSLATSPPGYNTRSARLQRSPSPPGYILPPAPLPSADKKNVKAGHWCLLAIVAIVIIVGAIIGGVVGSNISSWTGTSHTSSSTYTPRPSASAAASTSQCPLLSITSPWRLVCNRDIVGYDLVPEGVLADTVQVCMDACSSYNATNYGDSASTGPCYAVSFGADQALALRRPGIEGNCFLKRIKIDGDSDERLLWDGSGQEMSAYLTKT